MTKLSRLPDLKNVKLNEADVKRTSYNNSQAYTKIHSDF